ncbi:non-ribosomal peptide synthetase [Paenibacillus sp. MMS18-CY102]|uniref:non-ribosomal peptide synthetase n=1 Tax=Paenibacillus sp. MMS18-CY102 TaxID=2682849 RepID=UPI001366058F|nr:amino acid adenylation domain-containing protein [Paenibacillus sp. MMS18-CY102]
MNLYPLKDDSVANYLMKETVPCGNDKQFELRIQWQDGLEVLAAEPGVSIDEVLLAVICIVLAKYTYQKQITVNVRTDAVEKQIGCKLDGRQPFASLLRQVGEQMNSQNVADRVDSCVERIVFCSSGRETVDQHLKFTPLSGKFGVTLKIEYKDVLSSESVWRMGEHILHVLNKVADQPDILLEAIEMVSPIEKDLLLTRFNRTESSILDQTFIPQFEHMVECYPERIAMKHNDIEISYAHANRAANQLARYFLDQGITTQAFVVIAMPRSHLFGICVLALWKIRAIYVPVEHDYPKERLAQILGECEAAHILTSSHSVRHEGVTAIQINDELLQAIALLDDKNVVQNYLMEDISYVIYTSGSTGKPKGVMIEHRGMMNHLLAKIEDFSITEQTAVAQMASQCFDISVWQLFAPLIAGGRTVIYEKQAVTAVKTLVHQLIADRISILEIVPSYLAAMLEFLKRRTVKLEHLQLLMVTGEIVKPFLLETWFQLYPEIPFANVYGPTEASDDITHYFSDKALLADYVPIGKPIRNMTVYIFDRFDNLCPVGAVGEICVAGDGVGPGYVRNIEKTNAVFGIAPFQNECVRMYRTGDLGYWLSDGNIRFIGRKDNQVKVKGYRIELEEIENTFMRIANVQEIAADVINHDGGNAIAVYYVHDREMDIPAVIQAARQVLPEYMIPIRFIRMEHMPTLVSGKLDRKQLQKHALAYSLGDS